MREMRLTQRNYSGMVFIPGYAPRCEDPETCKMIVMITNRLAILEDLLEHPGVIDSLPQDAVDLLKKKGMLK